MAQLHRPESCSTTSISWAFLINVTCVPSGCVMISESSITSVKSAPGPGMVTIFPGRHVILVRTSPRRECYTLPRLR